MGMPNNLILVRHGQSEGNVAVAASKRGDNTIYERDNGKFMTVPGHQWRLTHVGRMQAAAIGEWVNMLDMSFARHYVSPFVRTRETAVNMNLLSAQWTINRSLRERDWGDIGSMTRADFQAKFPDNAHQKKIDPLYWSPPGGESIAHVAENRVRNFLSTMHRECPGKNVLAVGHGELMAAFRLTLEYWRDEEFLVKDQEHEIQNCEAIHYSRVSPVDGTVADRLRWVRFAIPHLQEDGTYTVGETEWFEFDKPLLSNEALAASISDVESLLPPDLLEA